MSFAVNYINARSTIGSWSRSEFKQFCLSVQAPLKMSPFMHSSNTQYSLSKPAVLIFLNFLKQYEIYSLFGRKNTFSLFRGFAKPIKVLNVAHCLNWKNASNFASTRNYTYRLLRYMRTSTFHDLTYRYSTRTQRCLTTSPYHWISIEKLANACTSQNRTQPMQNWTSIAPNYHLWPPTDRHREAATLRSCYVSFFQALLCELFFVWQFLCFILRRNNDFQQIVRKHKNLLRVSDCFLSVFHLKVSALSSSEYT